MSTTSKAAFVRQIPETVSAEEVVDRARKAGLKIALGYVWNIRSEARRKRALPPGKPRAAARVARAPKPATANGGELTAAIKVLTARRMQLLDSARAIEAAIVALESVRQ